MNPRSIDAVVDTVRRLFRENGPGDEWIEIAPAPDSPDLHIRIAPGNKKSKDFYGDWELVLSKEEADLLGRALTYAANE